MRYSKKERRKIEMFLGVNGTALQNCIEYRVRKIGDMEFNDNTIITLTKDYAARCKKPYDISIFFDDKYDDAEVWRTYVQRMMTELTLRYPNIIQEERDKKVLANCPGIPLDSQKEVFVRYAMRELGLDEADARRALRPAQYDDRVGFPLLNRNFILFHDTNQTRSGNGAKNQSNGGGHNITFFYENQGGTVYFVAVGAHIRPLDGRTSTYKIHYAVPRYKGLEGQIAVCF